MNQYNEISGNKKSGFQGESYAKLAKSVVLGTIAGIFSSVVLMIIFAFVINAAFGDPDGALNIFTGIAASTGAAVGGFYASKKNGTKGFVSGLATGLTISLAVFAVMIFSGKGSLENTENTEIKFRVIIIICQIVFACVGGIFAANTRKSKKTARSYPVMGINKK